jgi:hypothetical protein
LSYLIASDYRKQIQDQNLQAVITSTPSIQAAAELAAQEECIGYLVQKYDTSAEFTDTLQYDPTVATYGAMSRVYLNANAYVPTAAYAVGSLTLQAGMVYINTTAIAAGGEVFNPAHWTLLGAQYAIFFAIFPAMPFKLKWLYNIGDLVFWKGVIYKCVNNTLPLDHAQLIQYGDWDNVPYPNYFPDDPNNGPGQWLSQGAYTIAAGSLLNTAIFTPGDNRSQQLVMYMIDIVLFHLHSRISPRNIPDLRQDRYDSAISWLKNVARGDDITAPIPKKQPPSGRRFRWGSNIKNINGY